MTNEEYTLLRSIAAADCTEGPNFDPALLTELLDAYDELLQTRYNVAYWREHALAHHAALKAERERCFTWAIGRVPRSRAAAAIRDGDPPGTLERITNTGAA